MEKKFAIDLITEKIAEMHKDWKFSCSDDCSAERYCKQHYNEEDKTCAKCLKEFYEKEADIPSEQNLVKEIYDKFLELDNSGDGLDTQKLKFFIFITKKLQQVGYTPQYDYRDLEKFI